MILSCQLMMLFDKGQDIARFGNGDIFGEIVVETGSIIGDNVFVRVNEHEPFSIALFKGSHAFEVKVVLSD
jgi:hypothetical protein